MASREFPSAHATARPPGFVRTSSPICRAGDESLSPCPSSPAALGDAAPGAVVVVGRADEAEPEGIHAELLLEREAVLQRVTDHVAERVAVDRGRLLAGQLVRPLLLLERAQLVRRPCPGARQAVEAALRVALDLVQLDERLERLAAERLGGVGGIEPLLAAAQVRVVRNDDGVAAGAGIETHPFDRRPESLRDAAGARLDVARHGRRHALVAEDDVAVEVTAERASRVLVA